MQAYAHASLHSKKLRSHGATALEEEPQKLEPWEWGGWVLERTNGWGGAGGAEGPPLGGVGGKAPQDRTHTVPQAPAPPHSPSM